MLQTIQFLAVAGISDQDGDLCVLRNANGNWNVPYVNWNGSTLNRNANWLSNDWNANERVVLVLLGAISPAVEHFSYLLYALSKIEKCFFFYSFKLQKYKEHKFERIGSSDCFGYDIGTLSRRRKLSKRYEFDDGGK